MSREAIERVQNPRAKAFLINFLNEVEGKINPALDYLKDGIEAKKAEADRLAKIEDYQKQLDDVYTPEERAQFQEEEQLPVNVPGLFKITRAHQACEDGDLELLKELIGLGADLSLRCNSGHTPRDKAVRHGHTHIMVYLDNVFSQCE